MTAIIDCARAQAYAAGEIRSGHSPGDVVKFARDHLCDAAVDGLSATPLRGTPAGDLTVKLRERESDLAFWALQAGLGVELGTSALADTSIDYAADQWEIETQTMLRAVLTGGD